MINRRWEIGIAMRCWLLKSDLVSVVNIFFNQDIDHPVAKIYWQANSSDYLFLVIAVHGYFYYSRLLW